MTLELIFNDIDESQKFKYLLGPFRFTSDASAPLSSPYTESGAAGSLILTQNDGQFSKSGGKLIFPAQSTPAWGDLSFKGAGLTRNAGLALFLSFTADDNNYMAIGWDTDGLSTPTEASFYTNGGNVLAYNFSPNPVLSAIAIGTPFLGFLILRSKGAAYLTSAGKILWMDISKTPYSTPIPEFATNNMAGSIDTFAVARLPGLNGDAQPGNSYNEWDHRDLDTTVSIASPAGGNTFTHTADTFVQFKITTLPTNPSDSIRIMVRSTDSQNGWQITCYGNGNLQLRERVNDVPTTRISAVGVLVAGMTITLKCSGDFFTLRYDGILAGTYTSSSFISLTGGRIPAIPTGSAIANLVCRTLDGAANVGSPNRAGDGIATNVLPGTRVVNDTFTHEADCLFGFDVDALPSSSAFDVQFRIQDATHQWRIRVYADGSIYLIEDGTTRGSGGAGTVTVGSRIVVVIDNETISVFVDTTLACTYASASAYKTQTSGKITVLPNGARISNLISWPRNLASAPNTPGAAHALEALTRMVSV